MFGTQDNRIGRRTLVLAACAAWLAAGCAGTRERAARDLWRHEETRLASAIASADPAVSAASGEGLTSLKACVDRALEHNRAVGAAFREWKAALDQVPQSRSLPDPMLTYGVFLREVETRVGPQKQRLGVRQDVPWFGTLGLRGKAALADAEAARQRYLETRETVARDVTRAYADLYHLGAALRITGDNRSLLTGWERILRARYATGRVSYNDLIKVQVELGKLEDRVTTLEQRRAPLTAELAALLDLPPGSAVPLPEALPDSAPAESGDPETDLVTGNHALLALAQAVDREKSRMDLAAKSGYPDFSLGVEWVQTDERDVPGLADNGKDPVMAMIGVRVPLWRGRVGAARSQAMARRRGAEERYEDLRNRLQSRLAEGTFRLEDAERKVSLYRDSLIPKGDQSLQAAFAAFESGESDFLTVLDAQRILLEFSLSLERARADRTIARAEIDALLGRAAPEAMPSEGEE